MFVRANVSADPSYLMTPPVIEPPPPLEPPSTRVMLPLSVLPVKARLPVGSSMSPPFTLPPPPVPQPTALAVFALDVVPPTERLPVVQTRPLLHAPSDW